MKLYAKIKSERASKGQGGNKYIEINLLIGNAKNPTLAGTIYLETSKTIDNGYVIGYRSEHDQCTKILDEWILEEEIISKCYCSNTELSISHYSDDHKKFICFHPKPCLNCPTKKVKKQKSEKCTECSAIYEPASFADIRCKNCGNHQDTQ